jgi:hypothetical protein
LKYFGVRGIPELVNIALYINILRKYNKFAANTLTNLIVRGPEIKRSIQEFLNSQNKNKFSLLNRIKTTRSFTTNNARRREYAHTLERFVRKYMEPICSHPVLHGRTIQSINESAINYVDGLIGNLRFVVNKYYQDKKKYDNKRTNTELLRSIVFMYNNYEMRYFKELGEKIAVLPCIDNALEEMSGLTLGETFQWGGKNATKYLLKPGNHANYTRLLNNHIVRVMNSLENNNKTRFNKASSNVKSNMLWNKIKGKQVSILNESGRNGPMPFIALSQYNTNGKIFKNRFKQVYLMNN